MKRILAATGCLVAWGFLVVAGAQTPQPYPTAEKPPAPADGEMVTLTGCLAAGEEPDTFRLTNIKSSEDPAAPGGMVGTTGLREGGAIKLKGTEDLNLKPHVGHTVEVIGTISPAVPPTETPRPEEDPAATRQETDPAADLRLDVDSFKHVDATCPPAAR
jgi:hypothetical protein